MSILLDNVGFILKKFRKNRNISQTDLCKGIITRQTYSKIENNQLTPSYETLVLILKRLNYEISDFAQEINRDSEANKYYELFLKGLNGELNLVDAETLFIFVDKRKNNSSKDFHLYGIVKGHLHRKFPTVIPNFNDDDKNLFKSFLNSFKNFYSLYDLKIIGDFSTHLLDYNDLIDLFNSLPNFYPFDYGEESELYRTQIHKIYNNTCDAAIFSNDLSNAKHILSIHKKFAEIHPELRYLFFIKVNEITINFKETQDSNILESLLFIGETMDLIGDSSTANAIKYQYTTLKNASDYSSFDSITYD